MKKTIAVTGNSGPKIRSDCEITLEIKSGEGIVIDLTSKVKSLYGDSIIKLTNDVLTFFSVKNAYVRISDSGALPFVITARIEAAVKQLVDTDLEYLPESGKSAKSATMRDRFRFARLYLPGNSPGLMINAGLHSADGIILDLEDSVAPDKKEEARILIRNALRQLDFFGAERMVRINQGAKGINDLHAVIPQNVNLILIPKCESPEAVKRVDSEILLIKKKFNIENPVFLMPIIETALGVENSFQIAESSDNVVALAIGLEDYTADLGVQRTMEGAESFYARTRIVVAAKAAGIQAIDSVFSDVADMEGLRKTVSVSKSLGFEGMGCIHPRQIPVIRKGYAPDETEIEKSGRIALAWDEAEKKGLGVVALGSKMIDPPVVNRALKTIEIAIKLGLISSDWKNTFANKDK